MLKFLVVLLSFLTFSMSAHAQGFFSNSRVGNVQLYHSTVGTTSADAIADASVGGNLLSWKICNDAVNTSTYLYVGKATDAATDGVMLDKGQCFVCDNCKPATLQSIRVKAQAASNGYSVIQYRQ